MAQPMKAKSYVQELFQFSQVLLLFISIRFFFLDLVLQVLSPGLVSSLGGVISERWCRMFILFTVGQTLNESRSHWCKLKNNVSSSKQCGWLWLPAPIRKLDLLYAHLWEMHEHNCSPSSFSFSTAIWQGEKEYCIRYHPSIKQHRLEIFWGLT